MRTDRWNKKRELNLYAFYDHTGLERHLEKMAANGWMLESVGTYALRYRRCEPKKLRFAVVYYPKTDSFCPDEPNHENLTFWDYCAGAGWQIVTQRDDTHIFYNEDLDAVPIETEAVVQCETMCAPNSCTAGMAFAGAKGTAETSSIGISFLWSPMQ